MIPEGKQLISIADFLKKKYVGGRTCNVPFLLVGEIGGIPPSALNGTLIFDPLGDCELWISSRASTSNDNDDDNHDEDKDDSDDYDDYADDNCR